MGTAVTIVMLSPTSVFGIPVPEGSALPNQLFYVAGILIGAGGGILQASSRTMLTRQGNPERMTEAFGLYALSGKATSFLAPALIALVSDFTGNQRLGVTPLILLFAIGLVMMLWVKPDGERADG
jgi:UMF1 family MFS transporter